MQDSRKNVGNVLSQFRPLFLNLGQFPPRGHLAMSRDLFNCHNWAGDAIELMGKGQECC